MTMKRLALMLSLAVLPVSGALAQQDYPNRTIRVYTTSSAGGISDIFMRALNEELRPKLGQALVVENRPGGSQNIGTRACAEAPPDGYTICIANVDPVAYNQFLFKNIGFDPDKQLQPITNLFDLIQVLVVNADLKVKTTDELIALSKKDAGKLSYTTASVPLALYMENMRKEKGADWVRVPFRGGGDTVNSILNGTTPIALIGLGNVAEQINAGKMTPLAMVNNIKSPQYPNVPTLAETGYKGAPSEGWYGLFAPAGTPRPIVDKINKAVHEVFQNKEFVKRHLIDRGLVPAVNTPEEFAAKIKKDRAVAEQVVKDSGIQPQ